MKRTEVIAGLSALAQEARLDTFRLLVQAGAEGLAVGQIAERLGLPSPTLSFHISQLRHAGLVTFRRQGRSLIYAANFTAMNGLMAYLMENCCAGDGSNCAASPPACDLTSSLKIKEGADA